jgi:hypothetical protein
VTRVIAACSSIASAIASHRREEYDDIGDCVTTLLKMQADEKPSAWPRAKRPAPVKPSQPGSNQAGAGFFLQKPYPLR